MKLIPERFWHFQTKYTVNFIQRWKDGHVVMVSSKDKMGPCLVENFLIRFETGSGQDGSHKHFFQSNFLFYDLKKQQYHNNTKPLNKMTQEVVYIRNRLQATFNPFISKWVKFSTSRFIPITYKLGWIHGQPGMMQNPLLFSND